MENKKINYVSRDFLSYKEELIKFSKIYYPDLVNNFNDSSIFSLLLDINAGIADNLSYHMDRSVNEVFENTATQRTSLYNLARNKNLKIPGNRPSVAIVEISVVVPVKGDKEDDSYLPVIKAGTQVIGGGQTFELFNDVDFANTLSSFGVPNREKIPIFNSNNRIVSYRVTKKELIINGKTKIISKVINQNDSVPFLKITLPDRDVLSITSVISKDGTNFTQNPTENEFNDSELKWYMTDSLAQGEVFVEDLDKQSTDSNIKYGKWIKVDRKFIFEYTPENYATLTFGSSVNDLDSFNSFLLNNYNINYDALVNNVSLGLAPRPRTTIFIKYRVGGGRTTILGPNVLNSFSNLNAQVNGQQQQINQAVLNSLKVTNITSTLGGADAPSIEEIRNYIAYNNAAQDRAIKINDYKSLIFKMDGRFGAPSKFNVREEQNKVVVSLLGYNEDGSLSSQVPTVLMSNISNYLSNSKAINDYIFYETGEIINLAFDVYLYVNRGFNPKEITPQVIDVFNNNFSNINNEMGKDVFIGKIQKDILAIAGVVNIVDFKVFNKVGGVYENGEVNQSYINDETKEIGLIDNTIFIEENQIATIKFLDKDIRVFIK